MTPTYALLAILCAAVLGACGSGGGDRPPKPAPSGMAAGSSSTATTGPAYSPTIDPARFTHQVTNRYYPLTPGTTYVYEGTRDGRPQRGEVIVTNETRAIMGVPCVVVRDTVTSNGALVEQTTDWYAQAANGDVWYFGEDTKEYENGVVTSTKGSWEAGVDGAQPGIIMKADPKPGDSYRQEYRPGEAEDTATVLPKNPSITVPAGTYRDVVVTEDSDPLNPDKVDEKSYAPGVGLVYAKRLRTGHQEELSLVKVTAG